MLIANALGASSYPLPSSLQSSSSSNGGSAGRPCALSNASSLHKAPVSCRRAGGCSSLLAVFSVGMGPPVSMVHALMSSRSGFSVCMAPIRSTVASSGSLRRVAIVGSVFTFRCSERANPRTLRTFSCRSAWHDADARHVELGRSRSARSSSRLGSSSNSSCVAFSNMDALGTSEAGCGSEPRLLSKLSSCLRNGTGISSM